MSKIVKLSHPSGARVEVHKNGANIIHFSTAQDPSRNVLFVSKEAVLDGQDLVYGGIPIVFPTFGDVDGQPFHGFARQFHWELLGDVQEGNDTAPTVASFRLQSSTETKKIWEHDFELVYDIQLFSGHLVTALHVRNTSTAKMSFKALLHTYYSVEEVQDIQIDGLKGQAYFDKVVQQNKKEEADKRDFRGETDNVYANSGEKFIILTPKRDVTIEKVARIRHGKDSTTVPSDVVVWNPWVEKTKTIDMENEEYHVMVCVEPGRVSEEQELDAGKEFTLLQTIRPTDK